MAEVMKLQQLKCPNCNKPLTSFSAFKSTATCPRCGTVIQNPNAVTKEEVMPERIIPFTTDESNFELSLVNALVQQDYVPRNIFESVNTGKVFRAYLPMYLYEGTYMSSWSCESSYEDEKVSISQNWTDSGKTISTKKVKKWRPQNGNASGNFSFLCLANEGSEDLPEELRQFTRQFPYDVMMSKQFDPDLLSDEDENLITIPRNADASIVWSKAGKEKVDETAEIAARSQIGDQEIRNFRASSSFNLTTKGEYILAPFWFVYYTYNNEQYNFMLDGTGQQYSYNYPIDEEEVNFVKSKEKIKSLVGWAWLLFILVWFLLNFTSSLVYLGLWFVAKIIVNKKMNKEIETRLDDSRAARKAGADKLM